VPLPKARVRGLTFRAVDAEAKVPGDTTTVLLLHRALNRLIVERLTLPGIFTDEEIDGLVTSAVDRMLA
jgi:hypothetical protein